MPKSNMAPIIPNNMMVISNHSGKGDLPLIKILIF